MDPQPDSAPGAASGGRRPAGALEAEILAVLQTADRALTPGEVTERMGDGLAYSTVVTTLSRLHAKGVLIRSRRSRAYAYAPVVDAPGMAAQRMRQVLESVTDRNAVLTRFVDKLSPRDEALFRRLSMTWMSGSRGNALGVTDRPMNWPSTPVSRRLPKVNYQ